jgi:hypothetical protein
VEEGRRWREERLGQKRVDEKAQKKSRRSPHRTREILGQGDFLSEYMKEYLCGITEMR